MKNAKEEKIMIYTTEKKHTEYRFVFENEKIVEIIVEIPNNENGTIEEEKYVINSETLEQAGVRRICYKAFKRLWSVKNLLFLQIEKTIKVTQPDLYKIVHDAGRMRRE